MITRGDLLHRSDLVLHRVQPCPGRAASERGAHTMCLLPGRAIVRESGDVCFNGLLVSEDCRVMVEVACCSQDVLDWSAL